MHKTCSAENVIAYIKLVMYSVNCVEMQCHTNRCYLSSTFFQGLLNPVEQILKIFWRRKAQRFAVFLRKRNLAAEKLDWISPTEVKLLLKV